MVRFLQKTPQCIVENRHAQPKAQAITVHSLQRHVRKKPPPRMKIDPRVLWATTLLLTLSLSIRIVQADCTEEQFTCQDDSCILRAKMCDGRPDCPDSSDEVDCDARLCRKPHWFQCAGSHGSCIAAELVCNGHDNCLGGEDERDCPGRRATTPKSRRGPKCSEYEYTCQTEQQCIPLDFMCDGKADCHDGSDETAGCLKAQASCKGFFCANKKCLESDQWRCDSVDDCGDNSDESNCTNHCTPALGKFLCHDNSTCLDVALVCDGKPQCRDASDESPRCTSATSNCSTLTTCKPPAKCKMLSDSGPECMCPAGYRFSSLQNVCVDIHECAETYGLCSQGCENTSGSYRCTCDESYKLLADNRTCRAHGGEALLLYTTQVTVMGVRLPSRRIFTVAKNLSKVIGVAFDGEHIYWTNIQNEGESIVRAKADGSQQEVLLTSGIDAPEDLAVDWWTGNIYFSDNVMRHIAVCSNSGEHCVVLVTQDVHQPRGIALWPQRGQLFWTDWGVQPMIARASMDGTHSLAIVKDNIHWPNGIALDMHNDRIYWVDAKLATVESARPDGSERRLVLANILKHPYGLAIFEDRLYWSDWGTKSVHSCQKFTGKEHRVLTKDRTIYGVHVYHPAKQLKPDRHPCTTARCSHLCLLAENSAYTCACPDGMQLGADQLRCVKTHKRQRLFIALRSSLLEVEHTNFGRHTVARTHQLPLIINEMAYNSVNATVFLVDNLQRSIFEFDPADNRLEVLVHGRLGNVTAMAFDHLAHVLYWTDSERHVVEAMSLRTRHRAIVSFFAGIEAPIGLALVPEDGVLYVALRNRRHMHIDQLPLDGRAGEHAHIFEDDLGDADIKFTVDFQTRTLYWSDSELGRITFSEYRNMHAYTFRSRLRRPYAMALVDEDLFWSELRSPTIHWTHKSNLGPIKRLDVEITSGDAYAHTMPTRIPLLASTPALISEHPCQANNGGCSHVCVTASRTTAACLCPAGLVFRDTRNQSCIETLDCEFRCRSGECLTQSHRCNGRKDCPDASDEEGCEPGSAGRAKVTCKLGKFACHDGEQCVPQERRCDDRKDCRDSSDEEHCEHFDRTKKCHRHQHVCNNGRCVDFSMMCDGVDDCGDKSDETACLDPRTGGGNQSMAAGGGGGGGARPRCDASMFQCSSGSCIARGWECDGKLDCTDGSDEHDKCSLKDCPASMHKCLLGQCIDTRLVCDGHNDCGDMSDELNCDLATGKQHGQPACAGDSGAYQCASAPAICLPAAAKCNGTAECPRGEDEADCGGVCGISEFQCRTSKECIRLEFRCDHDNDCKDGTDEQNCEAYAGRNGSDSGSGASDKLSHERPCESNMFDCKDGQCVDMARVCDDFADCDNGADEGPLCKTACRGSAAAASGKGVCDHKCRPTPTGAVCSCFAGYRLDADQRSCADLNECHDEAAPCAQLCENTLGSYRCSCYPDFMLRPDKTTCKSIESESALMFSTHNEVRSMSEQPIMLRVVWSANDSKILGFDVDVRRRSAFFAAENEDILYKVNLTSGAIVAALAVSMPTKVAVDWITGNIYVISRGAQHYQIRVCSFDAQMCGLVAQANPRETIKALTLDAYNRRLFYVTIRSHAFGQPQSVISIARPDGHKSEMLVSQNGGYISAIAVDAHKKQLYYIDAHARTLQAVSYKVGGSSNPIMFIQKGNMLVHPSGLSVYENEAFLVNIGSRDAVRCALFGARTCKAFNLNILNAADITVDGASRQPMGVNPCDMAKCSGMCILAEFGYECMCGEKIVTEQTTCHESHQNAIADEAALLSATPASLDDGDDGHRHTLAIALSLLAAMMVLGAAGFMYYRRVRKGHRHRNISFHFQNPLSSLVGKTRNGTLHSDDTSSASGSGTTTASFEPDRERFCGPFSRFLRSTGGSKTTTGAMDLNLQPPRSPMSLRTLQPDGQMSSFILEDDDAGADADDLGAGGTLSNDMNARLVP